MGSAGNDTLPEALMCRDPSLPASEWNAKTGGAVLHYWMMLSAVVLWEATSSNDEELQKVRRETSRRSQRDSKIEYGRSTRREHGEGSSSRVCP